MFVYLIGCVSVELPQRKESEKEQVLEEGKEKEKKNPAKKNFFLIKNIT